MGTIALHQTLRKVSPCRTWIWGSYAPLSPSSESISTSLHLVGLGVCLGADDGDHPAGLFAMASVYMWTAASGQRSRLRVRMGKRTAASALEWVDGERLVSGQRALVAWAKDERPHFHASIRVVVAAWLWIFLITEEEPHPQILKGRSVRGHAVRRVYANGPKWVRMCFCSEWAGRKNGLDEKKAKILPFIIRGIQVYIYIDNIILLNNYKFLRCRFYKISKLVVGRGLNYRYPTWYWADRPIG